jgi:DNA-binding NarL/FixJ family response regulator
MINILVADDQALVSAGLRAILDNEPNVTVVGEARDGVEAVELARQVAPDVALLDVRMPRLSGIEATRLIVDSGLPTRVLILTTFDLDEYVYDAFRAGASGFLLKDAPRDQLLTAVRTVAAGEALLAPAVTRRLIERFVLADSPRPKAQLNWDALSDRDTEVLRRLARGQSNAEIAGDLFISLTTVKSHVGSILHKLNLRDRVHAVVFAYESGLCRPETR